MKESTLGLSNLKVSKGNEPCFFGGSCIVLIAIFKCSDFLLDTNKVINQYLKIFNRLAGSADEMGDFVLLLKRDGEINEEKTLEIEGLKAEIANSSLQNDEKLNIQNGLDKLIFNNNKLGINKNKIEAFSGMLNNGFLTLK